MRYYDFYCEKCDLDFEALVTGQEPVQCGQCGNMDVAKRAVGTKAYKIKGDNSASVTPKKHR